jgi:hypothetical protein
MQSWAHWASVTPKDWVTMVPLAPLFVRQHPVQFVPASTSRKNVESNGGETVDTFDSSRHTLSGQKVVGAAVVGWVVGPDVGDNVGAAVGRAVGTKVGAVVGTADGATVGAAVGRTVGATVGATVGNCEASVVVRHPHPVVGATCVMLLIWNSEHCERAPATSQRYSTAAHALSIHSWAQAANVPPLDTAITAPVPPAAFRQHPEQFVAGSRTVVNVVPKGGVTDETSDRSRQLFPGQNRVGAPVGALVGI